MNKFILIGIILCACLVILFILCGASAYYFFKNSNPNLNPNLNPIPSPNSNPNPSPNPNSNPNPNTIIKNPYDLTTTFLVKTTTTIKGKISDMNLIHGLDLSFRAYKLTKMYTAYIKIDPPTIYEYEIISPDIPGINLKKINIYATSDSEEFAKALILVVIPNSTITIYNTITKETKQVVATAIEKENILTLYKSYQA